MRKFLYVFGVFSLLFVLAGCDFLPQETIDQISEELCKEDPDNELCDLDNLKSLEEDSVIILVEDAFMKAKEKANKTKCSSVFSPSNPDLLETCRLEDNTLIPTEVTSFDGYSVMVMDNMFEVIGSTNLADNDLKITVSVVEIDGTVYIDSWKTELVKATSLTEERVKLFTNQFVMDDSNYADLDSYEIIEIDWLDDGSADVYVRVRFKAGSELSKKVNIVYDGDNDIFKIMEVKVNRLDKSSTRAAIDSFFDIFVDVSVSDDELMKEYSNIGGNSTFLASRSSFADFKIEIKGLYETANDSYIATLDLTDPAGAMSHWTLEVRVNRWESKAMIDINDIDNDCDGIDDDCNLVMPNDYGEESMQFLIDSFFDIEYSNQEINDMYFDGMAPDDFFSDRDTMIADGYSISIKGVLGPSGGGIYIFLLEFSDGANRHTEPTKVRVMKRIDKATPLLSILDDDDDGDMIPTDSRDVLKTYFETYNHMSMLSSGVCMYVPFYRQDTCVLERDQNVSMGYVIEDYQVLNIDGYQYLRIRKRPDLLTSEWEYAIDEYIVQFVEENGMTKIDMIQSEPDYEMFFEDEFEQLVSNINDPTLDIKTICPYSDETMLMCSEIRDFNSRNMSYAMVSSIELVDGRYILRISFGDAAGMSLGEVEYEVGIDPTLSMDNPIYVSRDRSGENPLFDSDN